MRLRGSHKQALFRLVLARPRWGNLKRMKPFSSVYGFERGTPIDRFYIEGFLNRYRSDIRGHVLEVQEARYTVPLGGNAVVASDVLDIDRTNPSATIVADLSEQDSLPMERFHCFILTQTLQYVPAIGPALRNSWQSLRPEGVLLLTVPTLTRVDPDLAHIDFWRITPAGLARGLSSACPEAEIEVVGFGNLVAGVAFLMGLAAEELKRSELENFDPAFPILACARVRKPPVSDFVVPG